MKIFTFGLPSSNQKVLHSRLAESALGGSREHVDSSQLEDQGDEESIQALHQYALEQISKQTRYSYTMFEKFQRLHTRPLDHESSCSHVSRTSRDQIIEQMRRSSYSCGEKSVQIQLRNKDFKNTKDKI